ncbi:hypothetical protein CU098_001102 [Rhizopus stolonifer]|uniref:RRM domain-containing protein n=1 Tax=Rhizopus stolonifer TaxID=4846 RepID=A0A367JCF7_RHIST|nr:hypothetical protein CU098_001102 [Rhizopus stolonifer]
MTDSWDRTLFDRELKSILEIPPPPVDTASLLATLSNIGNLNIPGLTTTAAPPQQENNDTSLPPALAKLLGGIVTSSPTLSPVSTSSTPPLQTRPDPRVTKDPRQKQAAQWPPQIPSSRMERKSRWGHDDDNNNKTHVHSPPPPPPTITSTTTTTTTTTTPIPTPTTTQDPWFNRQAMTQAIMNNDNTNYSYQANPSYYQQPYQQPYGQDGPFNQASFGGPPTSQFSQRPVVPRAKPAFSPFDRAGPSFHRGGGSGGGGGGGFMRHGASAFERNGPSPQYERNGSRFDRNGHTQYEQNTSQYERNESQYERNGSFGTQPLPDPSLAPGFIRVLTRTLFVGPIPDHYEKEDVSKLFSKYGDIASVIVSKKLKGRHNAFLKYTTRASTEAAKHNGAGLIVEGVPVKVNWGFGFGPKKYFDYTRGDSIIPLSELSEEEKDNLVIARIGGFQGQPVRDGMIIEEPEAQYKPEWNGDRGLKRSSNNYPIDENRKRTRM